MSPALRRAVPGDAGAITALMLVGFETYRGFAPEGWRPPRWPAEMFRMRLTGGEMRALVADEAGEIVGIGACRAAREGHTGPPIPGMGHVGPLFVAQAWWGSGVAGALLGGLVDRMREQGFAEARLFTPTGQARARAFYAREGWREIGLLAPDEIGLEMVELRRPL